MNQFWSLLSSHQCSRSNATHVSAPTVRSWKIARQKRCTAGPTPKVRRTRSAAFTFSFSYVHVLGKNTQYILQWQRDGSLIAYCCCFFQQVTYLNELVSNSVPKTISQPAVNKTFASRSLPINEDSIWNSHYLNQNLMEDDLFNVTVLSLIFFCFQWNLPMLNYLVSFIISQPSQTAQHTDSFF